MSRTILPLIACAALAAAPLLAAPTDTADADARRRQTIRPPANREHPKSADIPSLYEGEVDDLGPQLLLLENPPHDWFFASADLQDYLTSNAALTETRTTSSDVAVLTAEAGVKGKPVKFGDKGGRLNLSGGYRYQHFQYGLLSGRDNHDIANSGGVKLDRLNFQTHTLFLDGEWSKGGWFAAAGLRYAAFIQNSDDTTSYQEYVPSVRAGHRWTLTERDFLTLDADADYRFTRVAKSVAGIPVEGDRNDRYDLGLNLSYAHVFGERLLVQTSYRFQYTDYTEGSAVAAPSNGREDFLNTFSLTVGYYFTPRFSVRSFASAEFRASHKGDDYENYNLGAGVMASLAF